MSPIAPIPLDASNEDDVLAVVRRLATETDVDWDPQTARTAFEQACASEPGVPQWAMPLHETAQAVGLRLHPWSGSARDAWRRARHDMPMVTALLGPDGSATWLVVGGKGARKVRIWEPATDDVAMDLNWRAFVRRVGEGDPDDTRSWLLAEPTAPATDLVGKPGSGLRPMGRLVSLLRAERGDLGVVLVYAVGIGILGLATPIVVQVLVNTVAFGSLYLPIIILTAILMAALTFAAVLRALKRYVVEILSRRVFVRMAADLSWRLPRVKVSAFDKAHGPELVNRFFDILTVQKAASSLLVDGLSAAIQAIVGLALLAVYHPALLGFDVFLVLGIVAVMVGLGRKGPSTAVVESKYKYKVAGWLEEVAAHPRLFKLDGGSELARQRTDDLAHGYLDAREDHFTVFFRQYVGTLALQVVAASTLLGLGGFLVIERQLSLGQLVAAELVVAAVLAAYVKFAEKLDTFYDLLAGLDKLGHLIDLPLEAQGGSNLAPRGRPMALTLDGAAFAFPDGGRILTDVHLELQPGDKVAIIGEDGSGKSILADMIHGLRVPGGGRVAYDGVDIRELRPETVRRQAALVRGAEVVTGSIAENVRLGRAGHDRTEILEALRAVSLQDTLDELASGVETLLGVGGAPLSRTQVLRMMIARAILGRPRLLIIDQTLDALSPHTRGAILQVLLAEDAPWTLVVLTQDPVVLDAFPRRMRLVDGVLVPAARRAQALEIR
jgi:putative ABC transport system ATP-binding protein